MCLRCPFCYALLLCVTGLVLAGGVGVPRWLPLRRRPGFGVCWALFRASLIPAVMRVECAPRSGALGGLGGCDAMSLMFCRPAGPFPVPGRPGRGLSARRALLVVATQSIALIFLRVAGVSDAAVEVSLPRMSTSPLSPEEIRAAAEAHHELGLRVQRRGRGIVP